MAGRFGWNRKSPKELPSILLFPNWAPNPLHKTFDFSKLISHINNMTVIPSVQSPKNQTPLRYKIAYTGVLCFSMLWLGLVISPPLMAEGTQRSKTVATIIRIIFSPICHQLPERTFHLCGSPLTVCARCFGIYSGFFIGVLIFPWFQRLDGNESLSKWILLTGLGLVALDVSLTWLDIVETHLWIKSLTGFILGSCFSFYVIPAVMQLTNLKTKSKR
jgi:uncharacterized membrane protein